MKEKNHTWKQISNSIYHPSFNYKVYSRIQDSYAQSTVIEFGFARRALFEGMKRLNLSAGAKILLPSFICRDLLSPFHALGIECTFYQVTKDLKLACRPEELPRADGILVIHWFGLETELAPYLTYCRIHQAHLIEDNAHGLFSRGSSGKYLGETGDLGIISVRKTLPVYTGALLLLKKSPGDPFSPKRIINPPTVFRLKKLLRPCVYFCGNRILNAFVLVKRFLRHIFLGTRTPISTDQDELNLPGDFIDKGAIKYCQRVDINWESQRRRQLYIHLIDKLKQWPIEILKKNLGENEVPYCFPFYCQDTHLKEVERQLKKMGLEVVKWPALPKVVLNQCPEYYQQLYFIKFLW